MGTRALIVVNDEKVIWSRLDGDKLDMSIEKVFKSEGQMRSSTYFVNAFIKKDKPRLKLWYDKDLEEWIKDYDVYYKTIYGIPITHSRINGEDNVLIYKDNLNLVRQCIWDEFNLDFEYIYKVNTVDLTYKKYKL